MCVLHLNYETKTREKKKSRKKQVKKTYFLKRIILCWATMS